MVALSVYRMGVERGAACWSERSLFFNSAPLALFPMQRQGFQTLADGDQGPRRGNGLKVSSARGILFISEQLMRDLRQGELQDLNLLMEEGPMAEVAFPKFRRCAEVVLIGW